MYCMSNNKIVIESVKGATLKLCYNSRDRNSSDVFEMVQKSVQPITREDEHVIQSGVEN